MVYVPVQCPYCQSTEVIKAGKQSNGAQRYRCKNGQCERWIFLLQYQEWSRWLSRAVGSARWLWHALGHHTGKVFAYVVGTHKDAAFLKLLALLVPFGITRSYTDKGGAYRRHLPPAHLS